MLWLNFIAGFKFQFPLFVSLTSLKNLQNSMMLKFFAYLNVLLFFSFSKQISVSSP